jgi:hypothetical protein
VNEPDVDEPDANADHREESTMEDVDKARREDRLLDEADPLEMRTATHASYLLFGRPRC